MKLLIVLGLLPSIAFADTSNWPTLVLPQVAYGGSQQLIVVPEAAVGQYEMQRQMLQNRELMQAQEKYLESLTQRQNQALDQARFDLLNAEPNGRKK